MGATKGWRSSSRTSYYTQIDECLNERRDWVNVNKGVTASNNRLDDVRTVVLDPIASISLYKRALFFGVNGMSMPIA